MERVIQISMNGLYLASTTQSKTCKEAVRKVREITKHGSLYVAGRGLVSVAKFDVVTAHFK